MKIPTIQVVRVLAGSVIVIGGAAACGGGEVLSEDAGASVQYLAYGGVAAPVPGRVEAERFDQGGPNVGYFDTTVGNSGGQFRTTDNVDIQVSTQGGFNVGWVAQGEWLAYGVNVASAGSYELTVSVASLNTTGAFHLELGGANISGPVTFAATGGYQMWTQVKVPSVTLPAGPQVIRLVADASNFNVDWFELNRMAATGDPTCATGVLNAERTACCAASCGSCGGTGCDQRPGGSAACCTSGVTAAGASCSGNQPPCVMSGGVVTPPAGAGNISPLLVGNNVWFNPGSAEWAAVAPAGLKIVRIGGHQYDTNFPSNAQLTSWVNSIKALGAEPMIQVSQYRTAAQAAETVRYFNVTTNNKVKYWNIGNEPWLQANRPPQATIAASVAGYVRPVASAMKAVDPTIKIFAPDEAEYLDEMYNALLGGSQDITGKDAAGRYYIDGVSWHRYAETANLAGDMATRIQKTRTRIDFANALHGRTGAAALQFGIGEFNSNAGGGGPCTFLNGQAIGRTYGSLMKYGGTYAALWSFKEGGSSCSSTDFGFLNGNNTPRPSFYHMQMISRNFSGNYADGVTNIGSLYAFGAVDTSKIVVMLINQGTAQTCNVRLNNDATTGSCQVRINAGTAVTFSQAIGGTTSMVLVFNRQGQLTKRITYASGGAPVEQNL